MSGIPGLALLALLGAGPDPNPDPSTLIARLGSGRYAEREVVTDGKTASVLLCEQLDVLAAQVAAVVDTMHRCDADRLLVNGRFLRDRFGTEAVMR